MHLINVLNSIFIWFRTVALSLASWSPITFHSVDGSLQKEIFSILPFHSESFLKCYFECKREREKWKEEKNPEDVKRIVLSSLSIVCCCSFHLKTLILVVSQVQAAVFHTYQNDKKKWKKKNQFASSLFDEFQEKCLYFLKHSNARIELFCFQYTKKKERMNENKCTKFLDIFHRNYLCNFSVVSNDKML